MANFYEFDFPNKNNNLKSTSNIYILFTELLHHNTCRIQLCPKNFGSKAKLMDTSRLSRVVVMEKQLYTETCTFMMSTQCRRFCMKIL